MRRVTGPASGGLFGPIATLPGCNLSNFCRQFSVTWGFHRDGSSQDTAKFYGCYCLIMIVSDASTLQGVPSTTSVNKPGNATVDPQFTLVAVVAPATAEKAPDHPAAARQHAGVSNGQIFALAELQ